MQILAVQFDVAVKTLRATSSQAWAECARPSSAS
jgi:hypothetical protein